MRISDWSSDVCSSDLEGFEASVHKIKEQVLPRLLERVDPEAAATLTKDELAEEFRPIIMEVLAELKFTLNRREQFALEKVLVDELQVQDRKSVVSGKSVSVRGEFGGGLIIKNK